jgi:hypothetical protein
MTEPGEDLLGPEHAVLALKRKQVKREGEDRDDGQARYRDRYAFPGEHEKRDRSQNKHADRVCIQR